MRRNRSGYYADKVIRENDESQVTFPTERETKVREPKYGIVYDPVVRLRNEPSYSGDIVGFVKKNTEVKLLSKDGEFYKVLVEGSSDPVYIASKCIREE